MTGKILTMGSRRQVFNGTAKKTSGGLTKSDLMMNKAGRIVSKAKHASAKKEMRLLKHGYGTQKGKFGFVKVGSKSRKSSKSKSRKMKGGMMPLLPLDLNSGDGIAGQGITPGGPQTLAGMAGGKRRSRRMYGGSGMSPLSSYGSASWAGDGIDGQGITPGGPQTLAGMAGGKRHRRKGMMGGTTQPIPYGPSNPQTMALNAA